MTVDELFDILKELKEKNMGNYPLADDDGDDIDEVAVVMSQQHKIVVIR